MKYANGHEFDYRMLRPSQLKVDPLYQRQLDAKRVNEIVMSWNGDLFNEPKVSLRDGQYWIFNGQHSVAAWLVRANGEDRPINCKVYRGMTWLDECECFIRQNGISRDVNMLDKLRAMKEAKYEDVEGMINAAKTVGFEVDFKLVKKSYTIAAVTNLYKAYTRLGADRYIDMLTAIRDAWEGDPMSVCGTVISAMTVFYQTYDGEFRRDDLSTALKRMTPAAMIRAGREAKRRNALAREIAKLYNWKRTKRRVDIDKL